MTTYADRIYKQQERSRKASRQQALEAFKTNKREFQEMLARLAKHAKMNFDVREGEVNWGTVGNIVEYNTLLRRITDSCFHEGEHAESAT